MDLFIAFTIFYLKIAFIWKTMKIPLCTFIRNTVRTDSRIEIPLCTFIQDCTIIKDTRVIFDLEIFNNLQLYIAIVTVKVDHFFRNRMIRKEVLLLSGNLLKESLRKSKRSEAGRQQKAALNDGSHQKHHPKRGQSSTYCITHK